MTMSEEELAERAKSLMLALMSNATTEKISPINWWPRAKSALLAGVARGRTWGEMVDTMCRKLEIQVLRNDTASSVSGMMLDGAQLREFKRVVRTQGIYIIAECQAERERQKAEKAKENV
jgi:hypothetical protein